MIQHVDQSRGKDTNDGLTDQTPKQTLTAAYAAIFNNHSSGDIYLSNGVFQEPWRPAIPINLHGSGNIEALFNCTTLKLVDDVSNGIDLVGSVHTGTVIENIMVLPNSPQSTGTACRAAGVGSGRLLRVRAMGLAPPTKSVGMTGIAIGHGEDWTIDVYQFANLSKGLIVGIEAQASVARSGHSSSNYQDRLNIPYEVYRSPLALSCQPADQTLTVKYTSDFVPPPFFATIESEGIWVPAVGAGGQLQQVQRSVYGWVHDTAKPGDIQISVAPLSQGNFGPDNQATVLPQSGTVIIGAGTPNAETVTFQWLYPIGNGACILRNLSQPIQQSHTVGEPVQDAQHATAVQHAAGVPVIQSYGTPNVPGDFGGGWHFDVYKGVGGRSGAADPIEEWWGTTHQFTINDIEEGSNSRVWLRPASGAYQFNTLLLADGTYIQDDGNGHTYINPYGRGFLWLTSKSSSRVIGASCALSNQGSGTVYK